MDVKEEHLLGNALGDHWYYKSKCLALDSVLNGYKFRRVLDIGAGSAIFSRHLLTRGADSAICVDTGYEVADRNDFIEGKSIRFTRDVLDCKADVVLLMDVLEHVDDDVGLIMASMKGAAPGAHVLISVPAFQSLFSAHDRFLEHRRRYTINSLARVVNAAGLDIVSMRYFFAFVLPVVAAIRFLQRNSEPKSSLVVHSPIMNNLLTLAHRAEVGLSRFNRIAGLSIFCLARRP